MLKKRSKIVNFRVTDEEFKALKDACQERGARCLSDYARTTALESASNSASLAADVRVVIERIASLELKLTSVEVATERTLHVLLESDSRSLPLTKARLEEN
jgi:hypothetical protein